jgi:hypothetical protein
MPRSKGRGDPQILEISVFDSQFPVREELMSISIRLISTGLSIGDNFFSKSLSFEKLAFIHISSAHL